MSYHNKMKSYNSAKSDYYKKSNGGYYGVSEAKAKMEKAKSEFNNERLKCQQRSNEIDNHHANNPYSY